MFTGIVQHVGTVRTVNPTPNGAELHIALGPLNQDLREGDGVAVNGACLTATALGDIVRFDVMRETLQRTTLGELRAGSHVNLERALPLTGRLDGHLVQGHVDGIATIREIGRGDSPVWRFSAEAKLTDQMVSKGSIAIDGVSLTLIDVAPDAFSVALIPTTLAETTLKELQVGAHVNIETDIIGKYIIKQMNQIRRGGGLSMDSLRDAGFFD